MLAAECLHFPGQIISMMTTEINSCLAIAVVACVVSPLRCWSCMGNPLCQLFALLHPQQNITEVAEAFGYSIYSKLLQVSPCRCCSGGGAACPCTVSEGSFPSVPRAGRGAAAAARGPRAQTLHAALAHGCRVQSAPREPAEVPVPPGAPGRAGLLPQSTHDQGHQGKCDSTQA